MPCIAILLLVPLCVAYHVGPPFNLPLPPNPTYFPSRFPTVPPTPPTPRPTREPTPSPSHDEIERWQHWLDLERKTDPMATRNAVCQSVEHFYIANRANGWPATPGLRYWPASQGILATPVPTQLPMTTPPPSRELAANTDAFSVPHRHVQTHVS